MKILVAGGRDFDDYDRVERDLNKYPISHIISGMARGADMLGVQYAEDNQIECIKFFPQWGLFGKSAGFKRNQQMLDEGKPDLVLVYWDGSSKGTAHMIDIAKKAGIKTIIKYYGVDAHNLQMADELQACSY